MRNNNWYPERCYGFLWRLTRVVFSDWAGSGYKWYRYPNSGFVRLFWTRAQAQY